MRCEHNKPPAGQCANAPRTWFDKPGAHSWRWSNNWNGNDWKVLPFLRGIVTRGIGRSGWRCYHCGAMRWEQTDTQFALQQAHAFGLIKIPTEPMKIPE